MLYAGATKKLAHKLKKGDGSILGKNRTVPIVYAIHI